MLDITAALRELSDTTEIHVISVDNECKEILLILNSISNENPKIKTINISKNKTFQIFECNSEKESACKIEYSSSVEKYLYEPNSSVMKSGLFKSVGSSFSLSKLHVNTHLYTSLEHKTDFPGRVFEVVKIWGNTKQELKELVLKIPKANISVRNFPLTVEEIRKKIKIKDGGEIYLFACTLADGKKAIIECRKA